MAAFAALLFLLAASASAQDTTADLLVPDADPDTYLTSYAVGDETTITPMGVGDDDKQYSFLVDDFGESDVGRFVPSADFVEVEAPGCDDDEGCNTIPTLNVGPATTFGKAKSESASSAVASVSWVVAGCVAVGVVAIAAITGYRRRAAERAQALLPLDMV